MQTRTVGATDRLGVKIAVLPRDALHPFVLANIETVVLSRAAIVFQGFGAGGFFPDAGHRKIADFEQLRRGEESHLRRIVVKRVDQASLLDHHRSQAAVPDLDGARQTRRSRAHHQDIVDRVRSLGHKTILNKKTEVRSEESELMTTATRGHAQRLLAL